MLLYFLESSSDGAKAIVDRFLKSAKQPQTLEFRTSHVHSNFIQEDRKDWIFTIVKTTDNRHYCYLFDLISETKKNNLYFFIDCHGIRLSKRPCPEIFIPFWNLTQTPHLLQKIIYQKHSLGLWGNLSFNEGYRISLQQNQGKYISDGTFFTSIKELLKTIKENSTPPTKAREKYIENLISTLQEGRESASV